MSRFVVFSLASIIIWGLYPLTVTFVGDSYLSVLFLAQSIGLLLWLAIMWRIGMCRLAFWQLSRKDRKLIVISGIANAAEYISFFIALKMANPIVPTAIFELWIIFLVLFEWRLWKAELKHKDLMLLCFAFVGAAMCIVDPNEFDRTFGFDNRWAILAVFSAAAMGLKSSVNSHLSVRFRTRIKKFTSYTNGNAREHKIEFISSLMPHAYSVQISVIVYFFVYAISYFASSELHAYEINIPLSIDSNDIIMSFVMGVFIIGLGSPVFIYALSIRPSSSSASVFYFIPIVAIISISIFYGNSLTYYFSFGVSLILLASYLVSLSSASINSSMMSALSAIVFGYVIVLLYDQNIDLSSGSSVFVIETSFVAFGLVIVFAIERANHVRLKHHENLFHLINLIIDSARVHKWPAIETIDLQKRISDLDRMQDPLQRYVKTEQLAETIWSTNGPSDEDKREIIVALQCWLSTKMNFFPRSHLFLIFLFGFVIAAQLIVFSAGAERPIAFFALILCAIVAYLIAYLWEQSHPFISRHAATHLLHQRVLGQYPRSELETIADVKFIEMHGQEFPVLSETAATIGDKIGHEQRRMEKHSGSIILGLAIVVCFYWIMIGKS